MLLFFPELPHNNPKKTPKAEALGVLRVLLTGILCLLSLYDLGCERSLTLYLLPPNSATRSVETCYFRHRWKLPAPTGNIKRPSLMPCPTPLCQEFSITIFCRFRLSLLEHTANLPLVVFLSRLVHSQPRPTRLISFTVNRVTTKPCIAKPARLQVGDSRLSFIG